MAALSDVLSAIRLDGAVYVNASSPRLGASPTAAPKLPDSDHVVFFHLLTEGSCLARLAGGSEIIEVATASPRARCWVHCHRCCAFRSAMSRSAAGSPICFRSAFRNRALSGPARSRCWRSCRSSLHRSLAPLCAIQSARAEGLARWTPGPVCRTCAGAAHGDPGRGWTVEELSRSALAERFTDLIGEPPMQYLTRWRLTLAAQALRTGNEGIRAHRRAQRLRLRGCLHPRLQT